MAETKAYVLCPIGIIFNVTSLLTVWGDDGSWGSSIGCGFGLFNGGVIVCRERSSRHLEFQLSRKQVLVNLP